MNYRSLSAYTVFTLYPIAQSDISVLSSFYPNHKLRTTQPHSISRRSIRSIELWSLIEPEPLKVEAYMAPLRARQSVSKDRFSAYLGALKTQAYHDSTNSRGAGFHGYVQTFPSVVCIFKRSHVFRGTSKLQSNYQKWVVSGFNLQNSYLWNRRIVLHFCVFVDDKRYSIHLISFNY